MADCFWFYLIQCKNLFKLELGNSRPFSNVYKIKKFDTFQFLQFCQILKSTDVQKMWFINSTSVLLSFSWTEPQIWLSCYLIHIGITILRHFLYSLYLCPCLGLQSVTKYLRLTLVFMWKSAPQEKFNRYFSGLFC